METVIRDSIRGTRFKKTGMRGGVDDCQVGAVSRDMLEVCIHGCV